MALKNAPPSPTTATTQQPPPSPSSFLSDELIYQILLNLPVRSILQFRCVCKSWKTLISYPQFVTDHLRTSISASITTHQRSTPSVDDERNEIVTCFVQSYFENSSIPNETEESTLTFARKNWCNVIGSCNGLVCLYGSDGCFRLWNPCTKLVFKISPPQAITLYTHIGFGYDQVNDEYKVLVGVWSVFNRTRVHTFGTGFWTDIPDSPFALSSWDAVGKFVSGNLNWLALKKDGFVRTMIISFDVENETCGEVPLPPQQEVDSLTNNVLDVLRNCLCVCFYSNNTHWVLWFMEEYGVQESWTKLLVIPDDKLLICRSFPCFQPLWSAILEKGVLLVRLMKKFPISYV